MELDVHAEKEKVDRRYLSFLDENLGVKLDSVLVNVSLPRWRWAPQASNSQSEREKGSEQYANWGPYQEVFQWLWERGVRDIHKVKVDDMSPSPHSDEAIVSCLKPFHVRELDWGKTDLSSSVISRGAPKVEILTLRSSGREAALLGWSCKQGLCNLEKVSQSVPLSVNAEC